MECKEIDNVLEEWLAGELDEPARAAVDAHVLSCTACKEAVRQVRQLEAVLSSQADPGLPAGFFERQRASVMLRLGPEVPWQAPQLSLVSLALVLGGYVAASMSTLMDSLLSVVRASGTLWASMDGLVPLYGLLLLMAVTTVARDSRPSFAEARR